MGGGWEDVLAEELEHGGREVLKRVVFREEGEVLVCYRTTLGKILDLEEVGGWVGGWLGGWVERWVERWVGGWVGRGE